MAAPSEAVKPADAAAAPKPAKAPKEKKGGKKDASLEGQMAALELNPQPAYIQHRIDMFDRLLKEYNEFIAAQPRETIDITLPDGSVKPAKSWETSPLDVAKTLSA